MKNPTTDLYIAMAKKSKKLLTVAIPEYQAVSGRVIVHLNNGKATSTSMIGEGEILMTRNDLFAVADRLVLPMHDAIQEALELSAEMSLAIAGGKADKLADINTRLVSALQRGAGL